MNTTAVNKGFRYDIEGIRAISIIAVIIYHFGYLPNGYYGVDALFVITGYFTSKSIMRSINNEEFSLKSFYINKIKRLLPSVLVLSIIVLIIGYFVMLPDDYDSLAQSVVATNIFSNNILAYITTGDYWDVVNDYKPLMHTWALGIEQQFYIIFPFIIWMLHAKMTKFKNLVKPIVLFLTILSLILFVLPNFDIDAKFYLLPFRFYQMSFGSLLAMYIGNTKNKSFLTPFLLVIMLAILIFDFSFIGTIWIHLLMTVTVGSLIVLKNDTNRLLNNQLTKNIGKMSYSLFLWHQPILAFYRYMITDDFGFSDIIIISTLIFLISYAAYRFIEQPFLRLRSFNTTKVLMSVLVGYAVIMIPSLFIYSKAGVTKDIPELGIVYDNAIRGIHGQYNDRIYSLDTEFSDSAKTKVFVLGDSFARDWANILFESDYSDNIEIRYTDNLHNNKLNQERFDAADYIFFSRFDMENYDLIQENFTIDNDKVYNVGTKNFGTNNGKFYVQRNSDHYFESRTTLEKGYLETNTELKTEWNEKYIDLISPILDESNTVPVFSYDNKYISQDTRHLTQDGAKFYAEVIDFAEFDLFH